MQKDNRHIVMAWTWENETWVWQYGPCWAPYTDGEENRDDDWPEDFERYMIETGWLQEEER